jgi:hypothetical protein
MSSENKIISNSYIIINTTINNNDTKNDNNNNNDTKNDNNNIVKDDSDITRREEDNILLPNLIYRFKFTEEFMEALYEFSKIHQYDERKDFKEAWKIWTEENEDIIKYEASRLNDLGYKGDVIDKMFKSARYYFRKKSGEKKQPRQRRPYISVTRELLDAMDNHIEKNIFNEDYQPKTGLISFCKSNEAVLKESLAKIFEQGINDCELIQEKIKKTYKNRYFILTQNKNK